MASLSRIRVYPIKSLDGVERESAEIVENGGLDWDRRYAIVDGNGDFVNGKREPALHRFRASFDLGRETIDLHEPDGDRGSTFHLTVDRDAIAGWLSEGLGYEVELVRDDEGGMPDDTDASGPTVIANGTLDAVAAWYDGIDADEMARRLRPNLVVDAPSFWEDRLYANPGSVVPFSIGNATFRGVNPCQRCVVPTRHPDTGEPTEGFRETFVRNRERTLPAWAGEAWFDHYFRLMVNTRVPEPSWGDRIAVGDDVSIGEPIDSTDGH